MLILLSPAKSLDFDTPSPLSEATQPAFVQEAAQLVAQLRALSPRQVAALMDLSDALATLNVARYASWTTTADASNAKQALLAFNGDVYEGLAAHSLTQEKLGWAQQHIRILSGLYGVLRPLDYLQPYRLEMGTKLHNPKGKNLYEFWGDKVTEHLNQTLAELRQSSGVVINAASEEYFKVVRTQKLGGKVITPIFEDWKGQWKVVSFYAKRARGLFARYAIDHHVSKPEELKNFDAEGYAFDASVSSETVWHFRRKTH